MGQMKRGRAPRRRSDSEILGNDRVMMLLTAISHGEVVRGVNGGDISVGAAHLWHGEPVRLEVRRMVFDELVFMPISGPPTLDFRGREILAAAAQSSEPDPEVPWYEYGTWADF